jgi:hypothetical protein
MWHKRQPNGPTGQTLQLLVDFGLMTMTGYAIRFKVIARL